MPLADIESELRMPGLKVRHAEVSQKLIYLQLAFDYFLAGCMFARSALWHSKLFFFLMRQ